MSGLVERLLSAAGFKPFYSRDDDKFVNDIAKARHEITTDDYGPSWRTIKSNHRGNVRREVRTAINALLTCGYFPLAQSDMREAADEITRLTARVAELEKVLGDIQAGAEAAAYGRYHIICHTCADTAEIAKQTLENL